MRIEGLVGLVTGGGSGLGAAVATMLARGGGRVAIVDRDDSGSAMAARLGDAAAFFQADVSKPDEAEAAVAGAVARFGRLDAAVTCAAVGPRQAVLDDDGRPHPLGLFRRAVDVNLVGLFDVVRWCAAAMVRNPEGDDGERGVIVNVSSIAGLDGDAGSAAYSATKGAVAALTQPLARDLGRFGIRVCAIAPGMMDTPMLAGLSAGDRDALVSRVVFPRRLGRADEFAALVQVVVETTMLNGEVVRLDAGARLGTG